MLILATNWPKWQKMKLMLMIQKMISMLIWLGSQGMYVLMWRFWAGQVESGPRDQTHYYYLQENHGFGWLSKGLSLWIRSRGFGCWSSWFQGCQISKKTKNVFRNSYVLQAVCYYPYYFQIYLGTDNIIPKWKQIICSEKFQRATHTKS